jgi:hypothetical protein
MGDSSAIAFLTNHARALLCLARDPSARMRDVAQQLGITERAVQRIVADLELAGYLRVQRQGRRNLYQVDAGRAPAHPADGAATVGALLELAGALPPAPPATGRVGRPLESFID